MKILILNNLLGKKKKNFVKKLVFKIIYYNLNNLIKFDTM